MPSPEKFRETLSEYHVSESTISKINAGFENLASRSPKKQKATYFTQALQGDAVRAWGGSHKGNF